MIAHFFFTVKQELITTFCLSLMNVVVVVISQIELSIVFVFNLTLHVVPVVTRNIWK